MSRLQQAAARDAMQMFAAQVAQPRPPELDVVIYAELTEDGKRIVVLPEGNAWGMSKVADRLKALTPECEWARVAGERVGAVYLPATWATVVQLGFTFNHAPGMAWRPGPALIDWTTAETTWRTTPPPEPLAGYPPWLTPRPYQVMGAAEIAQGGKFLILDDPGPQPEDTPVWTPGGWVPIGKLTAGDLVYDLHGRPVPVRAVKHFGEQPVYRLTFSDGTSTLATGSHRWRVWTKNDRKRHSEHGRVLSTDEILSAGLAYADGAAKFFLPQQPVLRAGHRDLPLEPYAYGALLGDGSLGGVNLGITCPDPFVLSTVRAAAAALGTTSRLNTPADRCANVAFHRNGRLRKVLAGLGALEYSDGKHVCPRYLHGAESQRRALLAGLLDTDGSVVNAAVEFSSASPRLAADVAWLARSLGAVATEAAPQPAGYLREDGIKVQCLLRHRVNIRFPADGPNPFRLARKAGAWAGMAAGLQRRNPPRSFASMMPAGQARVCCIELDTDDPHARVYLTDTALIPTHNTGKTVTAITGIDARRLADNEIFPILIVVPSWVVADHWDREIRTWAPGWGDPVLYGGPDRMRLLRHPEVKVMITTYATLRKDAPDVNARLVKHGFTSVVADEMHLAKNARSRQSQALVRVARGADVFVGLSGTPITRDTGDVYPLLKAMDPRSWPSGERMVKRYCERVEDDYGERITGLDPRMTDEFFAVLLRQYRRVAKADVLDQLPAKIYSILRPQIPPEWEKAYKTMEQDMLAQLPDGGELPVMTVLARLTRLSQLASSACDVTVTEEPDPRTGLLVPKYHVTLKAPSWKAESLMDVIAARQGKPVVVFTVSRQLAMITGREYCEPAGLRTGYITGPGDGITRKTCSRARDDFQAGKLDVIVCTAGAGALGITLTASSTAVMLQRPWPLDQAIQPEDRIHRIGAEIHDHVEIIDVVARGTVDERVRTLLREKAGQLSQFVRDPRVVRELLGGIT